jgi:predicted lysophospholipase L1 biosynthesis ABC-type transport system permease subunit
MSVQAAPRPGGSATGAINKQVELPFRKAFEFAVSSIRIRFWRSMVTAGGIFLGIAFLASILTSRAIAGPNLSANEASRMTWLVSLSLVVCTVGITNSMLMSVTERFKEIGTMKCLGALNQFVVKLFMIEAFLLGVIASTLGWAVGTFLIVLIRMFTEDKLGALTFIDVLKTLAFCVPVGAFLTALATYIPAIRAAQIPPAAALRVDV